MKNTSNDNNKVVRANDSRLVPNSTYGIGYVASVGHDKNTAGRTGYHQNVPSTLDKYVVPYSM
jgi:hypothetical protein